MKIFFIIISLVLMTTSSISQRALEDGKIDRGDFFMHYKIYGNKGPFIVILSGGPGSDVGSMQLFADSLQNHFRCVMLEQRGTGRSVLKKYDITTINMNVYTEDVEALRVHLKTEKLYFLGSSWGSMLAMLYASKYPQRVEAIVIAGAGILNDTYADIFDDNLRRRFTPQDRELRNYWREIRKDTALYVKASFERMKIGFPAYFYDRDLGIKEVAKLKITDDNFYVMPAFFSAHPKFDLRPLLPLISARVLIIQGRQDPGGEENVIEMNRRIKNSTLKFIERCGHMPEIEKPEETWKLIYEFLGVRRSTNKKEKQIQ